jgi:hypothetical protein
VVAATDSVTSSITGFARVGVIPAAATHFSVTGPSSVTAGNPFTLRVRALDAFNNSANGYRGTVHFTSSDPAATLPADYTFIATDGGVHDFTNGFTLRTAGSQTVTATDTVASSITGSASLNVSAAAAHHFQISAPASSTAGSPFDLTVTVQDAFNNTVTAYTGTVSFTSSDLGASLPANYTFTTGDNGTHTFPGGVNLVTAGSQTVTASDTVSGINGSASIIVNPGTPDHFSIGAPATASSRVAFDVTVTVQDAFNNTVTGYTGTITFTSSDTDPGVVLPADYTFQTSDMGSVTFPGGVTLITPGDQAVKATDTVSGINGSATVTVTTSPLASASGNPPLPTARPAPLFAPSAVPSQEGVLLPLNVPAVDQLFAATKTAGLPVAVLHPPPDDPNVPQEIASSSSSESPSA